MERVSVTRKDRILVFGKYEPAPVRRGRAKRAKAKGKPMAKPKFRVTKDGSVVDIATIEANMATVVDQLGRILAPVERLKEWEIDEVEIDLGISGKGEIGLLGTGVGVEARAGIKLVLEKEEGEEKEEEEEE